MTELIYIVGSGRSGSTVIERVLHSAPQVTGVGELHALWRLPMTDLLCACGQRVPECAFWRGVLEHADIGPTEIARLAQLEREVVRNVYLVRLGYDLARIRTDPRLAEFGELQGRLIAGIGAVDQSEIVLDSSKAGPRAWVLAATQAPLILHVHRSAEDVIASWRRPKFEPSTGMPMKRPSLGQAALDWIKAEQAARRLASNADVARVEYGAFSTAPKETLTAALERRLPDMVDAIDWRGERNVRPAAKYHSILGNPDRFDQTEIVISPQHASDRSPFGVVEKRVISAIGRTLERAYP